jgi:hypothetical protein
VCTSAQPPPRGEGRWRSTLSPAPAPPPTSLALHFLSCSPAQPTTPSCRLATSGHAPSTRRPSASSHGCFSRTCMTRLPHEGAEAQCGPHSYTMSHARPSELSTYGVCTHPTPHLNTNSQQGSNFNRVLTIREGLWGARVATSRAASRYPSSHDSQLMSHRCTHLGGLAAAHLAVDHPPRITHHAPPTTHHSSRITHHHAPRSLRVCRAEPCGRHTRTTCPPARPRCTHTHTHTHTETLLGLAAVLTHALLGGLRRCWAEA